MKKIYKKCLFLTMLSMTLCSCGESNPQKDTRDKVDLFYAYSHENLRSNYNYYGDGDTYKNRGTTIKFNTLKGENDGSQLIIHARDYVSSYNFEVVSALTDDKGNVIENKNIDISVAWYQNVKTSIESTSIFKRGYYPDALIPIDAYRAREKDFILKDRNQAIYINLKTPVETVAGVYNGLAKLTIDGLSYDIPLEATVHQATLPQATHFKSCFLIWYDQIINGEKENTTNDLMDTYYDFVISKRLTPDRMAPYTEQNPTTWVNYLYERVISNDNVSLYRIPVSNNYNSAKVRAYMDALAAKQDALLAAGDYETNMFEKAYLYVDDEPQGEAFDRVREHDLDIYNIKKEYAAKYTMYPYIYNAIMGINHVVTTDFNPDLVAKDEKTGGVQTWCPQFQYFHSQDSRDLYKSRQESNLREGGESVWWYGCMDPRGLFPSNHLDATSVYQRVLPFMQYSYGIEANVYWCVNFYSKYDASGNTISRDIWYDPLTWVGCAGDGCLLYPGYDYGLNTPITTQRLENILAGNESYEYLYLLDQYIAEYNATKEPAVPYELNTLLAKDFGKLFKGVQPVHDSDVVMDVTNKIYIALDKFTSSLDEGMNYLLSLGE